MFRSEVNLAGKEEKKGCCFEEVRECGKEEKETILFGMDGMKGADWEGETKGPFILEEDSGRRHPNRQAQGRGRQKGKTGHQSLENIDYAVPLKGPWDPGVSDPCQDHDPFTSQGFLHELFNEDQSRSATRRRGDHHLTRRERAAGKTRRQPVVTGLQGSREKRRKLGRALGKSRRGVYKGDRGDSGRGPEGGCEGEGEGVCSGIMV